MTVFKRAQFQEAAVQHIVTRLRDKSASSTWSLTCDRLNGLPYRELVGLALVAPFASTGEPVPALPLIGQWLLELGLLGGGARQLYRRRRQTSVYEVVYVKVCEKGFMAEASAVIDRSGLRAGGWRNPQMVARDTSAVRVETSAVCRSAGPAGEQRSC